MKQKQRVYTNYEEFVKNISMIQPPEKPIEEIFVFEHNFSFRKITENEPFPLDKAVFKLVGNDWYYWDVKHNKFTNNLDTHVIERLLIPTYEKYLTSKEPSGTL